MNKRDGIEGTMKNNFRSLLETVSVLAGDIYGKGWAEGNAGNISVRLKPEEMDFEPGGPEETVPLGFAEPGIEGEHFLITCKGSYMRNISRAPEEHTGVIRIERGGGAYSRVWGFRHSGYPTSEVFSHLRAHAARKSASGGADRVVVHAHALNIIALTVALDLDSSSLTRLLWETHSECIVAFPGGVELLKWAVPGSDELSRMTAKALERRRFVVWPMHGILATGPDLDSAFGSMDIIDKVAALYLASSFRGEPANRISGEQLKSVVDAFGLEPDRDVFETIR
ncbi:MAG TPA: rhamnulose-1-phosphate aldolase [bacterium]|nr:rhamnulose-1-phosphate aldolase [bacterium]